MKTKAKSIHFIKKKKRERATRHESHEYHQGCEIKIVTFPMHKPSGNSDNYSSAKDFIFR